ncbi:MAG: ribonuclease H-like domain-containing protein [Syntrophobacteraceae bacterium]
MLRHTFVHLPGIGLKTERSLWQNGIHSWEFFHDKHGWMLTPFGPGKYAALRSRLEVCRERLCALDPAYFAGALAQQHLWRLFADFRQCAAFIDIETTGLGGPYDHITTATLYDGREVFYYIYGDNLDAFALDLRKYKILITYNGSCFDLPFIRNYFRVAVDHIHIDLRYLLRSLGYSGGLKGCEKSLGLDRAELNGVDGYFAVLLWREYRKTGNVKALETLLAYNMADTVNLETLMVQAFNMKVSETPFHELRIPLPCPPPIPFKPDTALIDELRQGYFSAF